VENAVIHYINSLGLPGKIQQIDIIQPKPTGLNEKEIPGMFQKNNGFGWIKNPEGWYLCSPACECRGLMFLRHNKSRRDDIFITLAFEIYHPSGIPFRWMDFITRIDIRAYKYIMPPALASRLGGQSKEKNYKPGGFLCCFPNKLRKNQYVFYQIIDYQSK